MDSYVEANIYKVTNPLNEDFTAPFNSRPYTVKAHQSKLFPYYLADHIANRMVQRVIELLPEKEGGGIANMLNKEVVKREKAKIMTLESSSAPDDVADLNTKTQKLVEQLNGPTDEELFNSALSVSVANEPDTATTPNEEVDTEAFKEVKEEPIVVTEPTVPVEPKVEVAESNIPDRAVELDNMTYPQLQAHAKSLELMATGSKENLIAKIVEKEFNQG